MTIFLARLPFRAARVAACGTLLGLFTSVATAQKPVARIVLPVDSSARVPLAGSRSPRAMQATDEGRMPGDTPIIGATIDLTRSAAQQTALDALIVAQQDPHSAEYHQWLSPDQFGAQFGAADADLAKVQTWLESQGLTVLEISRNRSRITFSGTAAQMERAFATEMHYVSAGGVRHFAPSSDLSLPSAFSGVVLSVGNLSNFRPHSHMRQIKPDAAHPEFTSSQTSNHFVQPGDVSIIYDLNAAYAAGYTGVGQSIAVVGQSSIVTTDITNFQTAAGVPVRAPNLVLVPNTGAGTVYSGDESESDLDLEYTSAIAKGATIYFVYGGASGDAFGAMEYAITNKTAPIVSVSYGTCEAGLGSTSFAQYNAYLQQAASQGQTVISAAGDDGSTDCFGETGLSAATQEGLSADFPASSQYVTGMGGSEFLSADVTTTANQFWTAANGSDVITSALSYIPETTWNDDSASAGLSAGGGGISLYAPRPSWQLGVVGIPAGTSRLLPDISLASSPNNAGYLYCSSDTSTGITGSCSHGFRDTTSTNLTVAGGTSFAAPIFSGMLALISQKINNTTGQGVINPTLYNLAANAATYATAFHDITTGTNACTAGATYCSSAGAASFAAGVGYDEATGLGSVDLYNLLSVWPNPATLVASSSTLTSITVTPLAGAADMVTIKVTPAATSTSTPTGSVTISIDGAYDSTLPLVNGSTTYIYSSTNVAAHVVTAVYLGDIVFSTSSGTVTLTVQPSTLKPTATTLSLATSPATANIADAITITVVGSGTTPAPTGTVQLRLDGGTPSILSLTPGTTTSTATYSFTSPTVAAHTLMVIYLGDSVYATSIGTASITVQAPGTFTLSAPAVSVTDGSTASEVISVTPTGGYSGTVLLSLTTPVTIPNACYAVANPTVTGAATTATVSIYTNSANCPSGALPLVARGTAKAANDAPRRPGHELPAGLTLAGLLAVGVAGRRSRRLRGLVMMALLATMGFALSGCGGTSTAGAGISTNATTGTYTVTVSGTDSVASVKTTTTTFTLTIH